MGKNKIEIVDSKGKVINKSKEKPNSEDPRLALADQGVAYLIKLDPEVELDTEVLKCTQPEYVYEFLKKRFFTIAVNVDSAWKHNDNNLEKELIQRNDRLIDLGIARYGFNREITKQLFLRKDRAIELACLSGTGDLCWDRTSSNFGKDTDPFLTSDKFKSIVLEGDLTQVYSIMTNRFTRCRELGDIILRKGVYEELSEPRYKFILSSLIKSNNSGLRPGRLIVHGKDFDFVFLQWIGSYG